MASPRPQQASTTSKDVKEIKNHDPFPAVLDDKILGYTEEENFVSTHYDPEEVPQKGSCLLSFFQNRLPVVTLLQHAVYGEYKAVDAMLTKNPLLLLEADTVVDYSGRKHFNRTVLQLALGAKDIDVKGDNGKIVVDGMIPMIEGHFQRLPNKKPDEIKTIMEKQYEGQYPKDYKDIEAKQDARDDEAFDAMMTVIKKADDDHCERTNKLEDKIHTLWRREKSDRANQLKNIIQTIYKADDESFSSAFNVLKDYIKEHQLIKSAEFDFTILEALYRFRNYWEPKKAFTIGKHFNHKILDKSATEYDTNYHSFGAGINDEWNAPKNIFCWQKILGWLERFAPAPDAQVIADGPWFIIGNGNKSQRTLNCRFKGGHYYPLGADLDWELGYNCAIGIGGQRSKRGTLRGPGGHTLRNLCQAKTSVPIIMQWQDNPSPKNCCIIL